MRIACHTLWLPKKGNTEEEYEDAAAPLEPVDEELSNFRAAVADGATETSFSRLWAKLLVDGFLKNTDRDVLREQWQASIADKQLPWYAEEKAQSGAYAALVTLILSDGREGGEANDDGTTSGGRFVAEAIGDSCLILVRDSKLIERFPLTHSDEFNSSPALLSSNMDDGNEHHEELRELTGEWQPGDIFYLVTDALARWIYKRDEEYKDAAFWLQSMNKQDDITHFAEVQRELTDAESKPLLRNDDVTLMRIRVE